MHKNWRVVITRVMTFALGAVFIIAALTKSLLPPGHATMFGELIYAHPWFANGLIGIEIALGVWLINGWRNGVAAFAALLLLAIFSGAIIYDMAQHYPQPCGCFGAAWKQAHEPVVIERGLALGLGRNALLAAAATLVFLAPPGRRRPDSDQPPTVSDQQPTEPARQ